MAGRGAMKMAFGGTALARTWASSKPISGQGVAAVGSHMLVKRASLVMLLAVARASAVSMTGSMLGGRARGGEDSIQLRYGWASLLCRGGASGAANVAGVRALRGGAGGHLSHMDMDDGRIEMILGPMFAGKSTELMRRIRRHKLACRRCVIIKYQGDIRHGEKVDELSTHDKIRIKAVPCKILSDVWDHVKNCDVVGIDEAQFFPDLVEFCDKLAEGGKIVILSALDGDFMRKPFGDVLTLIPKAECVTKLSSVCKLCHKEAAFTRRTTADTQLEVIGGAEMYMPTCRKCFTAPLELPHSHYCSNSNSHGSSEGDADGK